MKKSLLLSLVLFLAMGFGSAFAQDDPFAAMGEGDLAAPDGSSSLRGLKVKESPEDFEAQVVKVIKTGHFPIAAVEVKITKEPKTNPNNIKKGDTITLLPKYFLKPIKGKLVAGEITYIDPATPNKDVKPVHPQYEWNYEINQASGVVWYLEAKDKVRSKLTGTKKGDKTYYVEFLERK